MAPVRENDILFAYKALSLVVGLPEATRRVGAAIIDHFNKRTGQCDPGIDRLCALLGIDRATVKRATQRLHAEGMIEKISHGGKSHRTCYLPNWERFNAIVADWDARMKAGYRSVDPSEPSGSQPSKGATMRRSQAQRCAVDGRSGAPQTLLSNPSNKPIQVELSEKQRPKQASTVVPSGSNGLRSGSAQAGQRSPSKVVLGVSHGMAAEQAALRRLDADLMRLGWQGHAQAIELMTPELQDEATAAEMRCKGGGLRYLMDSLGPALLAATRGRPA